jgi:uncharacterized protein YkwD
LLFSIRVNRLSPEEVCSGSSSPSTTAEQPNIEQRARQTNGLAAHYDLQALRWLTEYSYVAQAQSDHLTSSDVKTNYRHQTHVGYWKQSGCQTKIPE